MAEENEVFTVAIDGKDITLKIRKPTLGDYQEAGKVKNETFYEMAQRCPTRGEIDVLLKEKDVWNDKKEADYQALRVRVGEGEKRLDEGGFNINEARKLAIELRKMRIEMRNMLTERSELDSYSAEGQAENAHFNCLVSRCVVYNDTNQPYFESMKDYLNNMDSDVAMTAARKLADDLYAIGETLEQQLPENQFLSNYGFVDDKLRLINKEGHLVDVEDRLIDEDGYFVNEHDQRVDRDGNLIKEFTPFTDDAGNEVNPKSKEVEEVSVDSDEKPDSATEE
jgi:hypothetical protein